MKLFLFTILYISIAVAPLSAGEGFREGGEKTGQGFKQIGKDTGEAFRDGGKKVGQGFKEIGQEAARETKKAGKTVGEWFRDIGRGMRDFFKGGSR